ncbi:MAG: alcohol dehydrogenase catalytic domain-containing protein [Thermoproteus sp.]
MRAVRLVRFGKPSEALRLEDLEDPRPGKGEVLVKVEAAGVCGRDLVVRKGAFPHVRLPVIPGHEGVGKVVDVGPGVDRDLVGQRVFVAPAMYDGTCDYCRRGLENLCRNAQYLGEHRDGTYSEYVVLPSNFVYPFHGVDPRAAVLATDVIPTAIAAVRRVDVDGRKVLVVGGGGTGLYLAQVAKLRGAEVYISTRSADKAKAYVSLGIGIYQEGMKDFDVVFDTAGSPTIETSIRLAKRNGVVVLIGNVTGERAYLSPALIILRQIAVLGHMAYKPWDVYEGLDLLRRGLIAPVYTEYKLSEAVKAHEDMEAGRVLGRAVLTP